MRRTVTPTIAAATGLAALTVLGYSAAGAEPTDPPRPIAVSELAGRAVMPDDTAVTFRKKLETGGTNVVRLDDPSGIVTARLVVQPGAAFPWHTHPGPVVVSVVEGDLTYVLAEDCVARAYPAGTAFLDPGNRIHTAVNRGATETVLVATFYGVGEDGKLTLPKPAPDDCEV